MQKMKLLTLSAAIIFVYASCKKHHDTTNPNKLKAAFSYKADTGNYPINIKFTNTSNGATSYMWDFGNGTTSTEMSPNVNFTSSTTYHVKLTVYNGAESDTFSQNVSVPFALKTVVVVYLLPSDVQYDSTYSNALLRGTQTLQTWFQQQLNGLTYRFGNPLIHVLKSSKPTSWFIQYPNGDSGLGYWFGNARTDVKILLGSRYSPLHNALVIGLPINSNTEYSGQGNADFAVVTKETLIKLEGSQGIDSTNLGLGILGHQIGHSFGLPSNADSSGIMFHDHDEMGIGLRRFPNCVLLPNEKIKLVESGFFF